MDTQNKEFEKTEQRVTFSNSPLHTPPPDSELRQWLNNTIGETLFPLPPQMDVKSASSYLFITPSINKIHSTSADYMALLPFRPDMAFDSMWTTLEAMMMRYAEDVWRNPAMTGPLKSEWVHKEICDKVLRPLFRAEPVIADAMQDLLNMAPYSIGRFALVRMLHDREIMYASQFGQVSKRARVILGTELYTLFQQRYVNDGVIDGTAHYEGARKVLRMIHKDRLTFFGQQVKNPSDESLYLFVISVILYTSRCERFHGDYFSPFVSALASNSSYSHWYWLLSVTHSLFWIVFHAYTKRTGADIVTPQSIAESIIKSKKSLEKLL